MSIYPYSLEIGRMLAKDRANASRAEMMFDRYTALPLEQEREAFVLALVAELLVNHTRLSGFESARTIMPQAG